MLKVLDAINLSTNYLKERGIEEARLNAELFLGDILGLKRLELYLAFERPLNETEISRMRECISRRGKHEPLQYIIGHVEFYGFNFIVNKSVLIPRPETEILVETLLGLNKNNKPRILDIGCGSGNISVSLARLLPGSQIVGLDISEEALDVSRQNAANNMVSGRTEFFRFDIVSDDLLSLGAPFDIVVSNPPYVSAELYKDLQDEIRLFEPKFAVTDQAGGLSFYKKICSSLPGILIKGGRILFEAGQGQSEDLMLIMRESGLEGIEAVKDLSGIDRVFTGTLP